MSQDAHETESEKRIQNALNKPCRVELDTCRLIMIIDPKPYQSTHFFLYIPLRIHQWIFPDKVKHQQILPNLNFSRSEKLHKV